MPKYYLSPNEPPHAPETTVDNPVICRLCGSHVDNHGPLPYQPSSINGGHGTFLKSKEDDDHRLTRLVTLLDKEALEAIRQIVREEIERSRKLNRLENNP